MKFCVIYIDFEKMREKKVSVRFYTQKIRQRIISLFTHVWSNENCMTTNSIIIILYTCNSLLFEASLLRSRPSRNHASRISTRSYLYPCYPSMI